MLLIPFGVLRLAWTASAAAARTRTWPMARRSWKPSPCQRKLWSRPGSRWASTSPVSPQRPCAARPPAPRATPSLTSPQPRGRLSRPPSYLGRGTTTGAMTIRWRCGLTVEVRPPPSPSAVSSHTHSPTPTTTTAAPPSPCWVASPIGSYSGGARTKAATVTGGSEGHQLKLRRRPPSKRPKLHHACGLAYREEKKKEEM